MSEGKNESDIAIVGMALRFPGASSARQFWSNLERGVESVRPFSDEELLSAGANREEIANPRYVKSGVVLEDFDGFDAEFFGFSPKEAAILDPQHRHFLECAWEALEDAGHPPESFDGSIGVFGGCGMGAYFAFNLLTNPGLDFDDHVVGDRLVVGDEVEEALERRPLTLHRPEVLTPVLEGLATDRLRNEFDCGFGVLDQR